jgi:5-(carboxyamino)imidazole ribonucleotide synthase
MMASDKHIGILGGGQLGGMLIRHAIDFGVKIAILESDLNAATAQYSGHFTCGDCMDYDTVVAFGTGLDIITIEKEAVNVEALKTLRSKGVKVHPAPEIIEIIQDKYSQKQFLLSKGIPVVPGIPIHGLRDLAQHADRLPGCLKLRRNGYDGKGVMMLREATDIENAFTEPSVLEELVSIQQEIAVIVARNEQSEVTCYDPVDMVFNPKRLLLDFQLCPAVISAAHAIQAREIALQVAEEFRLVGIMAIEMFVTTGGQVLVNELAPRPHNSGHHTIEAAATSQYEQLLRAIMGYSLGNTTLHSSSIMINLLQPEQCTEQHMQQALRSILAVPNAHLHWYGKKGNKAGRKMGHITVTAPDMEQAEETAARIRNILNHLHEPTTGSYHHG